MRINYAPTKGFEADVGSTTTLDLCNKENAGFLTQGKHKWRNSTLLLFEAHSRIIRKNVYHKLLQSKPAVRSLFLHSLSQMRDHAARVSANQFPVDACRASAVGRLRCISVLNERSSLSPGKR
jgi:hypothetical protein